MLGGFSDLERSQLRPAPKEYTRLQRNDQSLVRHDITYVVNPSSRHKILRLLSLDSSIVGSFAQAPSQIVLLIEQPNPCKNSAGVARLCQRIKAMYTAI